MRDEYLEAFDLLDKDEDSLKAAIIDQFDYVPYIVDLQKLELVDSVISCLLMAKLEQYFVKYPNGFCKFIQPNELQNHLDGLSWLEELGIGITQYRNAFRKIGVRYDSETQFEKAKSETGAEFKGKYYCSVREPKRYNRTTFYRNHNLVDQTLERLFEAA